MLTWKAMLQHTKVWRCVLNGWKDCVVKLSFYVTRHRIHVVMEAICCERTAPCNALLHLPDGAKNSFEKSEHVYTAILRCVCKLMIATLEVSLVPCKQMCIAWLQQPSKPCWYDNEVKACSSTILGNGAVYVRIVGVQEENKMMRISVWSENLVQAC